MTSVEAAAQRAGGPKLDHAGRSKKNVDPRKMLEYSSKIIEFWQFSIKITMKYLEDPNFHQNSGVNQQQNLQQAWGRVLACLNPQILI